MKPPPPLLFFFLLSSFTLQMKDCKACCSLFLKELSCWLEYVVCRLRCSGLEQEVDKRNRYFRFSLSVYPSNFKSKSIHPQDLLKFDRFASLGRISSDILILIHCYILLYLTVCLFFVNTPKSGKYFDAPFRNICSQWFYTLLTEWMNELMDDWLDDLLIDCLFACLFCLSVWRFNYLDDSYDQITFEFLKIKYF